MAKSNAAFSQENKMKKQCCLTSHRLARKIQNELCPEGKSWDGIGTHNLFIWVDYHSIGFRIILVFADVYHI